MRRRKQLGAAGRINDGTTFLIMAGGVMLGALAANRLHRSGFAASLGALAGFVVGTIAVGYRAR